LVAGILSHPREFYLLIGALLILQYFAPLISVLLALYRTTCIYLLLRSSSITFGGASQLISADALPCQVLGKIVYHQNAKKQFGETETSSEGNGLVKLGS
jgi:hypothetical protein